MCAIIRDEYLSQLCDLVKSYKDNTEALHGVEGEYELALKELFYEDALAGFCSAFTACIDLWMRDSKFKISDVHNPDRFDMHGGVRGSLALYITKEYPTIGVFDAVRYNVCRDGFALGVKAYSECRF